MTKKQTAGMGIKKQNRTDIYQLLRTEGAHSRQEILQKLLLSLPTVTQNLEQLVEEGLVSEAGFIGNTGGRRARTYDIIKNARTAIGLDITKNHVTAVAIDLTGSVVANIRLKRKFEQTDNYYRDLGAIVETLIKDALLAEESILGVGIGVPGLVTNDNQTVFYGEILNFTGATCAQFAQYIPYPSSLHNDANAAGFAEIWARREIDNAFYIMLSNNIGGSMVINSQIYTGENLRGGEVGHITIEPEGRPCYCGQRGCVDAYCAATVLSSLTGGNLANFFALLAAGDNTAAKQWDEYLDWVALTVRNVQVLFDCTIILGGYVGEYITQYLEDLRQRAAKLNSFARDADYLQICRYQTHAIAAGSALNYISEFIHSI